MKIILVFFLSICTISNIVGQTERNSKHVQRITSLYDKAVEDSNDENYESAFFNLDSIVGYMRMNQMPYYDTVFLERRDSILSASLVLLDKMIEHKPSARNFSMRGVYHGLLGDFESAVEDISTAIEEDQSNSNYYYNRAFFYEDMKKYDAALEDLSMCIKIDNQPAAYLNRGYLLMEMEFYHLAKNDFLTALDLTNDPIDKSYILNNLGYVYYKLKENKKALKNINSSIKINNENSYAFKNRALVEIAEHRINDACVSLEKAVSLGFRNKYGDEVDELISQHCK